KKGELFVRGSDLEIDITTSINVEADGEGEFIVPAGMLQSLVSKLTGNLTFKLNGNKLQVCADKGEYNLNISKPEDYPELPLLTDTTEIKCTGEAIKALKYVEFASARDDIRPSLTGILIERESGNLNFVATNGHKLAVYSMAGEGDDVSVIVPVSAVHKLLRFMPEGEFSLFVSKTHL